MNNDSLQMALIVIVFVISADLYVVLPQNHPANNLLSNDIVNNNRWVGQKGETSNSVVLQLEKSSQISSISIGTYHSALIEVLVGRSEASSQPFEVLICASSFMNPVDSRNSENISRVRSFSKEHMVPAIQSKKWDRLRIVCTQPFNKHIQFGLSFVELFSSDSQPSSAVSVSPVSSQTSSGGSGSRMLGRFKLRDMSSDEDDAKPGDLFARFKQKGTLSTDAQIRQAGSSNNLDSNKTESNLLVKTVRPQKTTKTNNDSISSDSEDKQCRRRDEIFYKEEEDAKSDKIDRIIKRDRDEKAKEHESKKATDEKKVKKNNDDSRDVKTTPKRSKNIFYDDDDDDGMVKKDKPAPKPHVDTPRPTKPHVDTPRPTKPYVDRSKDVTDSGGKKEYRKRQHSTDRNEANTSKKQRASDMQEDSENSQDLEMPRGPRCLNGVVFVLSGYVNPKRGQLRDAAISLGARYSPDWGANCTHLVCAFANTPKINEVKKSGVQASIVSGKWIEECVTEQAHLPWKWYAMDSKLRISRPKGPLPKEKEKKNAVKVDAGRKPAEQAASSNAVSDEGGDTDDEIEKAMLQQALRDSKETKTLSKETKKTSPKKDNDKSSKNITYDSESATDIDEDIMEKFRSNTQIPRESTDSRNITLHLSDSSDNESGKSKNSTLNKNNSSKDSVGLNDSEKTLPDVETSKHNGNEEFYDVCLDDVLPDVFSGIKFYIDPNLIKAKYDVDKVKRYVLAYKGEILETWPNKMIDVAVTTAKWAEKLREGKSKKCSFMPPEWVWKCNDERKLYTFEDFIIL